MHQIQDQLGMQTRNSGWEEKWAVGIWRVIDMGVDF